MLRNRTLAIIGTAVLLSDPRAGASAVPSTAAPNVLQAQTCPKCDIALTTVATLQMPVDFPALTGFTMIEADSRGNIVVADAMTTPKIVVFSPGGQLLRRFGAKGAGPGEFVTISQIGIDASDSLHVFDAPLRRISVFTVDGKFVRVQPMTIVSYQNVFLKSGGFAAFVLTNSREAAGWPLRLFRPDGSVERVLDDIAADEIAFGNSVGKRRILAKSSDGGFWVSRLERLALEKRSGVDGHLISMFEPKDHWLLKMNNTKNAAHPTLINAIVQDTAQLLWISCTAPDKRAERIAPAGGRIEDGKFANPSLAEQVTEFDSLLEVFDLRSKTTMVTKKFDDVLYQIRGTKLWLRVREAKSGEEIVEIVQPKLTGNNP